MTSTPPTSPDEPFDRVRAADPGATAEPDTARLRAAVTARTGDLAAGPDGAAGPGVASPDAAVPDELAVRRAGRAGRPARWLQVAAAVVGIAVVGGGGFALGRTGDGTQVASTAQAPIVLGDAGTTSGGGGAESAMAADSAKVSDRMIGGSGGRTVFTASGLSEEGGTATAWGFDAASVVTAESAARVAGLLGVSGEPVLDEWGSWKVGADDGSGPVVQVQPDGLANVSYYDPTIDPWACGGATAEPAEPADGAADAPATLELAPGECTDAANEPGPSADDATARLRDVMDGLGVDVDGFELTVQDSGSTAVTSVVAEQVVDGQRTGIQWNASFTADGVQSLWGSLAPLVDLGTYDVVSPAVAVERLTDPRFGASWGGVGVMAASDLARDENTALEVEPPAVPSTLSPGVRLPWAVTQVTLTSARLGLGLTTLPDGASVLLPSYELTGADGSSWSVVAVADSHLDFSPAG
ncbi:hypothetical protein ACGIF2_16790 [Cellulomonas sp. P22]|uniref:hypothetical protein n=1 Tax=Cellulomonas sp. P22 TaxID=3373189 RepID=UPI0037AAF02F